MNMTRTCQLLFCIAAVALLAAQQAPQAQSQAVVLRNVTLIDGTGAAAQPGMTVVITGSRITEVGRNVRVPPEAQVVDGTGKFVIPGLWDMHVHLRGEVPLARFNTYGELLLIANGVTSMRVMAGLPMYHTMQRKIEAGQVLAPRIAIASRNMDGRTPNQPLPPAPGDTAGEAEEWRAVNVGDSIPRAFQITNQPQARQAVTRSKDSGVEFLKIHNGLTPEVYFAIAAAAKAQGLYLTGHVPTGVSVAALSDSGMKSLEHFGGMLEGCSTREDELLKASLDALSMPPAQRARRNMEIRRMAVDAFSAEKCATLAASLVRNNTWLSPTFMPGGGIRAHSARSADLAKYVPPQLRARWQQQAAAAPEPSPPSREEQELAKLVEAKTREIVAIMKRAGVQFVIGTDAGAGWRVPGPTMHDAMEELNKAGLTPMDVLQAATSSSARLLGKDKELGTVQAGKLADLVVLDANPLQQITNTRDISAVVVNGRLLDRKALDEMLSQLVAINTN